MPVKWDVSVAVGLIQHILDIIYLVNFSYQNLVAN
jgi:hypothetical protein